MTPQPPHEPPPAADESRSIDRLFLGLVVLAVVLIVVLVLFLS